ncbi:coiled-coil domain-containing protein 142 isoform X2 [Athene noctua]|uniref:coiled-coil domain-containing protein 142 isoform X2 n=1 Tax=Athene noctua TaxID=126797 RepID=UPI003EB7F50E
MEATLRSAGREEREDEEEDEEEETPALLATLELSCAGLRRCLRVWEDPRTETVRGRVRPQTGDGPGPAAFSYHPVLRRVAERGAALHALLRHGHRLHLVRRCARRLEAAAAFLRRLLALPEPSAGALGTAPPLRELCRELRAHAGCWSGLRRRARRDPWLWPLRGDEPVAGMRRALLGLALRAVGLAERHAEARLRALARAGPTTPALLADLFQGLEIYNRAVGDLALELGTTSHCPQAFPMARVLGLLAAERGWLVAERLQPLLQPRDGGDGARGECWEDAAVPWPLKHGAAANTGPSVREEPPGLAGELRALCGKDEELMGLILGVLVASADGLRHRILREPKGEKPLAAKALLARYRLLFWGTTAAALGCSLGGPHGGTGTAAVQELSHALAQAGVPRECEEELGGLCLCLLCRDVLRSWDRDFARALGSTLSDTRSPAPVPVWSGTARCLRRLFPGLAFALRCLRALPARPPGRPPRSPCLRLQVLGCCLATAQAARSWLMGSACRYRAARALPHLLLLTQGDLPLLKTELDELVVLVSGTFPEPVASPPSPPPVPPSPPEHQLCRQIRSVAASIQLFSGDALQTFAADCKRVSAEIFAQTMPLGKHWRGGPRAELPGSPSPYAAAAAQAVLGRVLPVARLLPHDAQTPALARATTAFLEAWMDHILARRIKFSLQGALQLRQDVELVRELVGSERSGLPPETRQRLLALRVFQQMDGAILCLLQQPPGRAGGTPRPWRSLPRCCSGTVAHPQEPCAGSLRGLETLEVPVPVVTPLPITDAQLWGGGVPEFYLSAEQQQWLALRLHRAQRWRLPRLRCGGGDAAEV